MSDRTRPPDPPHRPESPDLSAREAFQVFRSEVQPTQNLLASTDLSPRPNRQPADFSHAPLRVSIQLPSGPVRPGRLLQASATGLQLAVAKPLPLRSAVMVEWTAYGGHTMAFAGRVVRSQAGHMLVQFDHDDKEADFLQSFIELARSGGDGPPDIRLRTVRPEDPEVDRAAVRRELEHLWSQVDANFGSDGVHQRFIQACLRHRHTPFALECYREAVSNPDRHRAAQQYLEQLGTILSFSEGMHPSTRARDRRKLQIRWWGVVVGLVLLGLAAAYRGVRQRIQAPPPPISTVPTQGDRSAP